MGVQAHSSSIPIPLRHSYLLTKYCPPRGTNYLAFVIQWFTPTISTHWYTYQNTASKSGAHIPHQQQREVQNLVE